MNNVNFGELDFNGVLIQLTQSEGFDMMINATEMWKSYGRPTNKRPYDWLTISGTVEYLDYLKSEWGDKPFTPVMTVKGNYANGTRQGTWMHRWVAIRYAQYLDPRFAVWVDKRIDELLKYGFTVALNEEREKYNNLLQSTQPKVDYYNQVLTTSENLYSTEQVCKELGLGISSKKLLQILEDNKLIYRRPDGKWFLSGSLDPYGYLKVVTTLDKKTGKPRNLRRWTEEGKHWIWSLRKKLNY